MNENIIKIYDFTSEIAVEISIGEQINELIEDKLKKYKKVILDFSNVKIVLTAFIKALLGSYLEKMDKEEFYKKIEIRNLPQYSDKLMERVFSVTIKKNS